MFNILVLLMASASSQAIIMERTYQAADSLGYQIVGEVEFTKNSYRVPSPEIDKQIGEIAELCPRTRSVEPAISSFPKFVILAWSDQDYPTPEKAFHSAHQQWLAHKRAVQLAEKISHEVPGQLSFELVNMANRRAHPVDAQTSAGSSARQDVKSVLESAGAAPSDALGFGLFAEYSQAAKAVIWVDCRESLTKKKSVPTHMVQLAALGRRSTGL